MREGWRRRALGEIADVYGGGTPSTKTPAFWGGDIPWITPTEVVSQDGKVISRTERTITQLGLDRSGARLLPARTVLVTSRATVGAVALTGVPIAINQGFAGLLCHDDVLPEWLMFWCQESRDEFRSRAGGSTFPEVSRSSVRAIPILTPPLHEQRRMIDLITSIDDSLSALGALPRLADAARLALMQEATREPGRTIPMRELVTTARAGGTPSRKRPDFFQGSIPWLKSGEVRSPAIRETEECISEEGLETSAAWLIPAGAVVVAMYGATAGAVGRVQAPMATNQAVLALVADERLFDQSFLFHLLTMRERSMKSRALGAAQPNLSKERVLQEEIPLPELSTQRRVARVCDALTELVQVAVQTMATAQHTRSSLLRALLAGVVELPDSYDRFLEAAS